MYDYSYLASDYARTATAADYAALGGLAGVFAGFAMFMVVFAMIVGILTIIANWKLFTKAGEAGWKSIIPIYNMVTLFKIAGLSGWCVLGYLAAIIPVIGPLVVLGLTIYLMINLAKAFGKEGGFAVGLILLNTIFIMILAFGSAEYQLDKKDDAEVNQIEKVNLYFRKINLWKRFLKGLFFYFLYNYWLL